VWRWWGVLDDQPADPPRVLPDDERGDRATHGVPDEIDQRQAAGVEEIDDVVDHELKVVRRCPRAHPMAAEVEGDGVAAGGGEGGGEVVPGGG
jgi:hypothetical protein